MANDHFRNIFLQEKHDSQKFKSNRSFSKPPPLSPVERISHARKLIAQFDAVWEQSKAKKAVSIAGRDGMYIEFISFPGYELKIQSLENIKSRIRLMNVRTIDRDGKPQTLATVFVPAGKEKLFLKTFQDYATKENSKTGTPRHKSLVESINDFHIAALSGLWTDKKVSPPGEHPAWVEVWLATDSKKLVDEFRETLRGLKIVEHEDRPEIQFPERTVVLIFADQKQLLLLIESTGLLAELRPAQATAAFVLKLSNQVQATVAQSILKRATIAKNSKVSVCILDHGVNRGHLMLAPVLPDDDLHTVNEKWGSDDTNGHGTLMAGTAAYGDILKIMSTSEPIQIPHRIESSKILPPGQSQNERNLWGHMTKQGIARAEIHAPHRQRIVCMAVTTTETSDRGTPSSWSGAVDQLAAGVDDETKKRLLLISAGNASDKEYASYPESNKTSDVEDPGQAWNALTVGAYTEKTKIAQSDWKDYAPLASAGQLSPFSTTSVAWDPSKWPIKPEIVCEGGNVARGPNGGMIEADELQLLSTSHETTISHFAKFNATSAATALAARMAAIIQAEYPEAWPETIRGLMVHSSQWTEAMEKQFKGADNKTSYKTLLRACGYGVPNLERAIYCLKNRLTLVSQAQIQPFIKDDEGFRSNEMHLYPLPWPRDVLRSLGETKVEMRVTLSYFVEPGPGEIGWENRYRYASHGLRFKINAPEENRQQFVARINREARESDDGQPGTASPNEHWVLGQQQRDVGSVHSDIWKGNAVQLSASNFIAVHPSIGWWRERRNLDCCNKKSRYSLIVSIHSPREDVDIYTPVAVQVGIKAPVPVPVVIGW